MGLKIGGRIDKVNGKDLSYRDFVNNYVVKNQPVVLTGLMDDWRACEDWVSPAGHPNLFFLSAHFGKSLVLVADCDVREFTDQKRIEMSVAEFIDHWAKNSAENHMGSSNFENSCKPLLYLKDWHFVKEYPQYSAYTTPTFFSDDWLNLYLNSYRMHMDPDFYQGNNEINCSDYRFVYMGVKGTWTPLHADVFRSHSWSANVFGKKQWHLLSPSQHHLVFDRNMKISVYDIFGDVSETKFPGFKKSIWLECTQEQNEIIFVPSGWYHQVHNLEDTISVNHNWLNANNLSWVWDLLLRDYNEARGYIEDIKDICDDFEALCQRNLAANTGMNLCDFFIFITRFSLANLVLLCNKKGSSSPMERHLTSNLESIHEIASKMKVHECFLGLSLDLRGILGEAEFIELCMGLGERYGLGVEEKGLVDGVGDFDFLRCSSPWVRMPDDLSELIVTALVELGGLGAV